MTEIVASNSSCEPFRRYGAGVPRSFMPGSSASVPVKPVLSAREKFVISVELAAEYEVAVGTIWSTINGPFEVGAGGEVLTLDPNQPPTRPRDGQWSMRPNDLQFALLAICLAYLVIAVVGYMLTH